jgi:hypothetical protein
MKTKRKRRPLTLLLTDLGACAEAILWSEDYGTNYLKAWRECREGRGCCGSSAR